jgi:hypothetical protein
MATTSPAVYVSGVVHCILRFGIHKCFMLRFCGMEPHWFTRGAHVLNRDGRDVRSSIDAL